MDGAWQIRLGPGVRIAGHTLSTGTPTVVLLHGAASNHRWWSPVAQLLAAVDHRVIWWDHRGHGESAPAPDPCTVEQLAADTAAILAEFDLHHVILVGHSLGAAVAITAAAQDEHSRVTAVGCVEGGLYNPRLLFGQTWEQARTAMLASRLARITEDVLRAWLPIAGMSPADLSAVLANFARTHDGHLHLRLPANQEEDLAHSLWSQDLGGLLHRVSVPILVIAADTNDHCATTARRQSIRQARQLISATVTEHWIPGHHDLPLTHAHAVATHIHRLASGTTRHVHSRENLPG